MKYLDRSKVEEPKVLAEKGKELSDANKEAFLKNPQDYIAHVKAPQSRHGKNTFDIKPEVYGCQEVKEALDRIQNGMCCYCECYYETSGKGEVEHFRPKMGYQQDKDDLFHRPGYFWLGYEWNNLMYSCKNCNEDYKKNYFPLKDNTKRANPEKSFSINDETPLLVNPYEETEPEKHFGFDGGIEFGITEEGKKSVEYYGLDREALNEDRAEFLDKFVCLEEIYQSHKGQKDEEEKLNKLKTKLAQALNRGKYTLMLRCHFKNYINE